MEEEERDRPEDEVEAHRKRVLQASEQAREADEADDVEAHAFKPPTTL